MLQMSQIENIRNLRLEGSTVAEIRKITNLDRKTIDKYLTQTDFSVTVDDKATTPAKSKLDPYKPIIDGLLEKERDYFHKQRFTATRMLDYLGLCEMSAKLDQMVRLPEYQGYTSVQFLKELVSTQYLYARNHNFETRIRLSKIRKQDIPLEKL
ncbi:MAG: hypothetical protein WBI82_11405, partial [Sphaerochaeta sp.]